MNSGGGIAFFSNLSMRERWVLGGGALVVALLIAYVTWIEPARERMATLDRLIPRKEQELAEFTRRQARYLALSEAVKATQRQRVSGASAFAFLEETAERNHLRNHIVHIRPLPPEDHPPYREVAAEVKLDGVRTAQLVPFLGAIEKFPYRLKRLAIKSRFADPALLDVQFVVSSYEKMER